MADVLAELRLKDGQRQKITFRTEGNLPSLITGIHEIARDVSRLLGELVEQERARGACADGEEEEESDDDDEGPQISIQPPTKKYKT